MASNAKTLAELIAADSSIDVANTNIVGVITDNQIAGISNTKITGTITAPQLAPTGVTPGVYGGASAIGALCIDASGRITAASNVAIQTGQPAFYICSFTSPGTFTKPASMDYVYVALKGGGGGGGGGGGNFNGGCGAPGNAGTTTSFGSYASSTGGTGGNGGIRVNLGSCGVPGTPGNNGACGSFSSPFTQLPCGTLLLIRQGCIQITGDLTATSGGCGGGGGLGRLADNAMEGSRARGGCGGTGGTSAFGTVVANYPQITPTVSLTIGSGGNGGASCEAGQGFVYEPGNPGSAGQAGSAKVIVYDV